MASSTLEVLVDCAQAIEVGDLKLANSLLEQIWNLAAVESDEPQSKVAKYFAEALVRRAYGLHPTHANLSLELTIPYYYDSLYDFIDYRVRDAIKNAVMGKKRLHLIDFCILHTHALGDLLDYLSSGSGDRLSVRLSVIIPPFLKNKKENEVNMLVIEAVVKRYEVELEVIYANSLGEVDDSTLDFRRTEDEALVVYYYYKLHKLIAEVGAMDKELLKLRHIKPEIVIIKDQDADNNDSNFIRRLKDSFQYYSYVLRFYYTYETENYFRKQIQNIVGCEGKDRIVRQQTLAQWRSCFQTAGFIPFRLELPHRWYENGIHEDNGSLVIPEENHPMYFISAWKVKDGEDDFNPSSNNLEEQGFIPRPLYREEIVQPLQPSTELGKAKSLALGIFNDLKNIKKKFVTVRVALQGLNEQGGVIPNARPPLALPIHASSSTGPHEQENGKRTSVEPLANNDNEILKADGNNLPIPSAKKRERKLTSEVWKEFAREKDGDEKVWAICNYCNKQFDGSSKNGTTRLKNHLGSCKDKADKVGDQQPTCPVGRGDTKNESAIEGTMVSFTFSELARPICGRSQRGNCGRVIGRGLAPPSAVLTTPVSQPTPLSAVVQGTVTDSGITLAVPSVSFPVHSTPPQPSSGGIVFGEPHPLSSVIELQESNEEDLSLIRPRGKRVIESDHDEEPPSSRSRTVPDRTLMLPLPFFGTQVPRVVPPPFPSEQDDSLYNPSYALRVAHSIVPLLDQQRLIADDPERTMNKLAITGMQLIAQIVAASHQRSHIAAEKDRDVESARAEAKKAETEKSKIEQSLIIAESSRAAAVRAHEEVVRERDEAIARANSIESERDQVIAVARQELDARLSELQNQNASLIAEQSAHLTEKKNLETVAQQALDDTRRAWEATQVEKEQALRAQLKDKIYEYGVGFRRSAIFLIRKKYPEIDLSGIDFPSLTGAEVPDSDDGEGIDD